MRDNLPGRQQPEARLHAY